MSDEKRVLVVCTGNSCRSIMAEALINQLGEGRFVAFSAGSQPTGEVHPLALETLRSAGVLIDNPRSQSWDEFAGQAFDYVITVCDSAAAETCPVFLGEHQKLHWSTPDPARAEGAHEELMAAFNSAFDQLKQRVTTELL